MAPNGLEHQARRRIEARFNRRSGRGGRFKSRSLSLRAPIHWFQVGRIPAAAPPDNRPSDRIPRMTLSYPDAANWLQRYQRPLLFSHLRPDGDALGSLAGVDRVLTALGKAPAIALFDAFPTRYATMRAAAHWHSWPSESESLRAACDCVIVVDTCSFQQLEPATEFLKSAPPTLVFDHHVTRDAIGDRPADLRLIDSGASATCLLVAEWIAAGRLPLDATTAAALFTGIATDTGWFRFPSTDPRTLRAAADLLATGFPINDIYAELYQQDSPAKLRLIGRALTNMQILADGKLAVLAARQSDFAGAGADQSMTEDVVNEATRLADTEATIFFNETPEGVIRINFRSKRTLDVAALAKAFGGGGHARAAGARQSGTWDEVTQRVIDQTVASLRGK